MEILGCDGAGVSIGDADGQLRFVTATDASVSHPEHQQVLSQDGPCLEAYTDAEVVTVSDIVEEPDRWPDYGRVVIEQAKGVIAARDEVDVATAFQTLRRLARDRRCRIHDVAQQILDGDLHP